MNQTANDTILFKNAIESYESFIDSEVAKETLMAIGGDTGWTKDVYRILNRRYKNYEIANDNIDDFLDLLWEKIEIHTPNYLEQKKRYEQLLQMTDSQLLTQQRTVSELLGLSNKESELIAKRIAEIKKEHEHESGTIATKSGTNKASNKSDTANDSFNIQNTTEHTDTRVSNPLDTPLENITSQIANKGNEVGTVESQSDFEHNTNEALDENAKSSTTENSTNDDTKTDTEKLNTSENKVFELFGDYSARLRAQINNSQYTIIEDYLNKFRRLFIRATSSALYFS